MAGSDPAIQVVGTGGTRNLDAPVKPGHDVQGNLVVMAGPDPAIQVVGSGGKGNLDARVKPGHDVD